MPSIPPQPPLTIIAETARIQRRKGRYCTRIRFGEKAPFDDGWQNLRIEDEDIPQKFAKNKANIGLLLGDPSGGIVDCDLDCAEAVALAPDFLPPTGEVFGRPTKRASHWIYRVPGVASHRFGTKEHGMILELRSTGHQTVIPPSTHSSGEPITYDSEGDPGEPSSTELYAAVVALAVASLLAMAWPVRNTRHFTALAVAGMLLQCGWDAALVERIIRAAATYAGDEEAASRVSVVADTQQKLETGQKVTGLRQLKELLGADAAKALAKWLAQRAVDDGVIDAQIAATNRSYGIVRVGNKVKILHEFGTEIVFIGSHDLHLRLQNKKVPVLTAEGRVREVSLDIFWLDHPQRREYSIVVFEPGDRPVTPGAYNLWFGWGVNPRKGDCGLFLAHVRDNVCAGNDEHFGWVIAWFAQIFQQPQSKPGTALVLRGRQGTGKSIVGFIFGKIIGRSYKQVASAHRVTGHFNSHLGDCLLLHADEAFWAGDKQAEGILKDLVTSDFQWIERKGIDAVEARNFVRLFVTSNADWAVPAGREERRFAVLDVSEAHMQDKPYFAAIIQQMESGGYEALLDYCLTLPLDGTDLRTVPPTAALTDQKISSLTPEQAWILDILVNGVLPGAGSAYGVVLADVLYRDFLNHAQRVGTPRRGTQTMIGKFLKKLFPGLKRCKAGGRPAYEFTSLRECREAFASAMKGYDWEEPWEWQVGDGADDTE